MKRIFKKTIQYFDLQIDTSHDINAERGIRSVIEKKSISIRSLKDKIWLLGMYLTTVFGVICKYLFDIVSNSTVSFQKDVFIQKFIMSSIISIIIFPTIYKNAIMNPKNPGFIQLCISFQNGFFWQTIIGEVNIGQ